MKKLLCTLTALLVLTACGQRIDVPPAHIGKIMTKDGYQPGTVPPSKLRLDACLNYCDKIILVDVSDRTYATHLSIFLPKDKLVLEMSVSTTLSIDSTKSETLFNSIAPEPSEDEFTATISAQKVYSTYAAQIVDTEVREYISQFSINEVASSNEQINAELSARLAKTLLAKTPFTVRHIGITGIKYPKIITDSQELAAERREAIQTEEAKLKISQVTLTRQLEEARLTRQIEKEKSETEAEGQRILAQTVDAQVLKLRELENARLWIEKWDGQLPTTAMGDAIPMIQLSK